MAEVGVSVAAKLAEYLVDPNLQQLQYLFCVDKVTKNVEIKKKDLILKQGKVQESIQVAINRTERIDGEVDKWKGEVESLIAKVENLEEELRANNGCLRGWCPTWRRYCLCKKLAKTTLRMIDLTIKRIEPFSHPVIVPDIEYYSTKDFMYFESTKRAHDELWVALQNDDISMIGLWGMGGSGKTTLVKEVGKKAKESKLFDRVIITTISQTPNTRKIQGEIADMLGLKLEEETEAGRARRIAMKLQSPEERILIILDDVWATLNLEDIGNPFGDGDPRNCKVLLTTRRQEVCTLMDCQKTIPLGLLTKDEAWDLFQTHAKVDDGAREVAQEVAMECTGLPIAVLAMGKCLKGKGLNEVNVVLHNLRQSKRVDVDKGGSDAFACLKLSYDYLSTVEAKLLFMMCAMFPEDHEIMIEDLFRYGIGLGLCKDAGSFEIARSQVEASVNVLINSSLLMHSFKLGNEKCVKMHDMVRDVALWIAPEEFGKIMVNCAKELNALVADEAVKDCYAVSSWYDNNKLLQFAFQLGGPNLEFLLMRSRIPLDISHASFEGTKGLKVLIILCTDVLYGIELQPHSIQHLSNLRTLRLQRWDLHDISFVVGLTRLEILDLRGSKFVRIPNGIEKLKKLKLLDLSSCAIDECCFKVIGYCSQLEELYVPVHFPHSKNENCYEYLMNPTASTKLRRYKLEIGECIKELEFQNDTRSLHLGQLNMCMLGAIIKDLSQRATAIQFYELEGGSKSFMTNIVQAVGGMNVLTELCLQKCSEIEYITDETTPHEDVVVPRLDLLVLRDMDNLRQLCHGPPFSFFQKLERLRIAKCPQLLHIFHAACNLGNLKFLEISDCPMLTSLFPVSTTCTLLSLEELEIRKCDQLKHVLEGEGDAWGNSVFPKLKILYVHNCCKLESVCPVFLAQRFIQLQRLSITHHHEMKFVFSENVDEEQSMHDRDETQLVFPLLEFLQLQNLPKLVRICSERYHTWWPSIKTIDWQECPNMELQELKCHQLRNEEYKPLVTVETITLHNCGVESIFHYQTGVEEQIPTFQYLKELTLGKCASLKFVFFAHLSQSLPELNSLTIFSCDELDTIFLGNDEGQKNLSITESCLLKLKRLQIFECNKLKFILSFNMISAATSVLPQLSTLNISGCSQMEEIFKCSDIEDHDVDSEREITFPNMKDMKLENLPSLVNVCKGFKLHTGEFCRVKVHGCPKLMSITSATVDWSKERLVRDYELKYSQLNNTEALNLPLSVLNVGGLDIQCPRVEHNWQIIGDDEEQETRDSEMLRSERQIQGVVPTQVLRFQYLHSLEVTHSKKLKFVFSIGTIVQNSLPKLTSLTLSDCEELELIIEEIREGDAIFSETIVFPSLGEIYLRNLPNFKSVCQGFQVEVRDINILNCPKFVDSSLGSALQQLGTISVSVKDSNVETSSNVNEEKGMVLISRAEYLCLEDSMSLISVWEGPTFISFKNLRYLYVSKCRKLKCMFPSTVMRSLPCLEYVWIEECEELEELMSEEEVDMALPNESSHSSFWFPKLLSLRVKRCRKLKWLFPSLSSTQHFPELNSLYVEECYELKGLFNSEVEIHEEEAFSYNNLLPNLKYVDVKECPIFSQTTLAALRRLTRWRGQGRRRRLRTT